MSDMFEKDIKLLEKYALEYNEEARKLNKKIEKYIKENKEIPNKLLKRIRECNALYNYYNNMIKDLIEFELVESQKRMERELNKSLNIPTLNGFGNGVITYGIN